MSVIDEIVKKAKLNKKRIVLPESEDLRILKAASKITLDNIADIILVGNEELIIKTCDDHNIDISNVKIVNNLKSEKLDIYANELYNLRKNKGVTLESAYEMLKDNMYYATMMVKTHLSLSHDPKKKGVPRGWTLPIRDILVYGGAKFLCPMAGSISLMPGTSSDPAFRRVDVDTETGKVSGLF